MQDAFAQFSSMFSATANLAVAGLLLVFWLHERSARWYLCWSVCYALSAAAIADWLLYSNYHGEVLLLTGCLAIAAASAALLLGISRFFGETMSWRAVVTYIVAFTAVTRASAEIGPLWAVLCSTLLSSVVFAIGGVKLVRQQGRVERGVGVIFLVRSFQLATFGPLALSGLVAVAFVWSHFMALSTGLGLLFIGFTDYARRLTQVQGDLTERNDILVHREEELMATNRNLEELAVQLEMKTVEYAEARSRADAANQAKSQFLANMSHELRTPLNAIIGFAELITAMPADPRGREKALEYAGYVNDAGHHLLNVVNSLLDLARIELNALELSFTQVSVANLTKRAVLLLQFAVTEKQIDISTSIPEGLDVMVDPQLMRQALVNVIGNAIKFSPAGSTVQIVGSAPPSGGAMITVSDNGPGIEAEIREKVFEPFWQTGDVFSRQHGGMGLGLSITRRIVEEHGGSILARNAAGGGAEIVITLPPNAPIPGA